MKQTGKRVLSLLLAVVLLLACVPNVVFAEPDDDTDVTDTDVADTGENDAEEPSAKSGTTATRSYQIGDYWDIEEGKYYPVSEKTVSKDIDEDGEDDTYVTYSKTIEQDDKNDDEFVITLDVETNQDLSDIPHAANVVLVFNVSDAMDNSIKSNDNGYPITCYESDWSLAETRWSLLKKTAKDFINKLLAEGSDNHVSIVVYGGQVYTGFTTLYKQFPFRTVHKTICNWTDNAYDAIESFYNYDVVSGHTANYLGLGASKSLQYTAFGDEWYAFGGTSNSQAGFQAALEKLEPIYNEDDPDYLDDPDYSQNAPYVIYMAAEDAGDSYEIGVSYPQDVDKATNDAIKTAKELKESYKDWTKNNKKYSDNYQCTIYTVGLGSDTATSKVLNKNTNDAVDAFEWADNSDKLTKFFDKILNRLVSISQAWTVTDPMSTSVNLTEVTTESDAYSVEDGTTITWNLKKETPDKVEKEDGSVVYHYTLTYQIKLNSVADWSEYNLTNKDTILTYLFSNDVDVWEYPDYASLTDDSDPIDDLAKAYFLIPSVCGAPVGSIFKEASVDEVGLGEVYNYRIIATNSGTATWKDVVAIDDLDQTYINFDSYLSLSSGVSVDVDNDTGKLKINFGEIPAGQSKSLLIYVRVNDDDNSILGDRIDNRVTVVDDKLVPDPSVDPYDDEVRPLIVSPIGSITKVATDAAGNTSTTVTDTDGNVIETVNLKVNVGDEYYYNITATNDGNKTWENVIATDKLDSSLKYVSSDADDDTVSEYGGLVKINFGNIEPGKSKTVKIYVEVKTYTNEATIYNTVTAKSDNYRDVEDRETVAIIGPMGTIEKTADVKEIEPGGIFTYTITASNSEDATEDWKNVIATDTLDDRLTIDSYADNGNKVTVVGNVVKIEFGDIGIDKSKSVTITVKVNANADLGELKNTVKAESDNYPDVSDDADVTVVGPKGSITKLASVPDVTQGERYYYTITATNKGTATWKDVVATDRLDGEYITFDSYTSILGNGVSVSLAALLDVDGNPKLDDEGNPVLSDDGTYEIKFGDIEPGESKTVYIFVRVNDDDDTEIGDRIGNTVTVVGANDLPGVTNDPGVDSVNPLIIGPNGKITKDAVDENGTSISYVRADDTFYYTITASNKTEKDAAGNVVKVANTTWENVIATDKLDNSLTYVDYEPKNSGITVTEYGGTVTINFGDIGIEGEKTVKIKVTVKPNAEGATVYNTVIAKSDNQPDVEDNATVDIVVDPIGTIEKTSSVDTVQPGKDYYYTIKASNSAKATETWGNVVATDKLDGNLSYADGDFAGDVGVTVTKGVDGTLTINFGDIAPGETKEVKIYVTVDPSATAGTVIENKATVVDNNGDPDPSVEPGIDPDPPVVVYPVGSIEKFASVAQVGLGESYYYVITASNSGNETWKDVVGTDKLSDYINFDYYIGTNGVSVDNKAGALTIYFGDIPSGDSKTVIIFVTVNDNAVIDEPIENLVTASGKNDIYPPVTAEDQVKPLITNIEVGITKIANKLDGSVINIVTDGVQVGESFTYTITATNTGNVTWENVIATDELNSALKYVGVKENPDSASVSNYGNTVTINFGDIPKGGSKTVTIEVTVKPTAEAGYVNNTVTAKSDNYRDVDASYPVNIIANPDGSITKTASVEEVGRGERYYYVITAKNDGTGTWENVVATDTLNGDYITFDSCIVSNGVTVDNSGGTLTINFGNIPANDSKTVIIFVKVKDTAAINDRIENTVTVKGSNDLPSDPPDPGVDPVKPLITNIEVGIKKIADKKSVPVGDSFTYTITATNNGNVTWESVIATDKLDSTLTYIDDPNDDTVSEYGGTVTITFGDIKPGESKTVKIKVEVKSSNDENKIYNTVTAKSDNYRDVSDNETVNIIVDAIGTLEKTSSVSEVRPGESYYYTIKASNSSSATEAWKGVVATDKLNDVLTFDSATVVKGGDEVIVSELGGTVTITFGDIAPGTYKEVTIYVTVSLDAVPGTTITNSVVAKGTDDPPDPPPIEDPDPPKVISPDVTITKTASVEKTQQGGSFEYTIKVSNSVRATEIWKNVIATDVLDGNLTYTGYTVVKGKDVTVSELDGKVTINFGDVYIGEEKEVTIKVSVNTSAVAGTLNNEVTAKSDNNGDVEDDVDVTVIDPGRSIKKTASIAKVGQGERYYYTITATNNGAVTWENVVGTDELKDTNITFDSYLSLQGVSVEHSNRVLTINFGNIPAGQSKTVIIYVKVDANAEIGHKIVNTVTVPNPDNPSTPIEGKDPVEPEVVGLVGEITKTASKTTVHVGDGYYYTITASNTNVNANEAWTNVIATDKLDSALTYDKNVIVKGDNVSVTQYGGTVTINFGDIAPGDSKSVEIYVKVKANAEVGTIPNTVTAKSSNYPEVYDNEDVNIVGPIGSVTKTSSVNTVQPGGSYDYTITATNDGKATETWNGVVATDALDTSLLSYVSSDSNDGVTVTNNSGNLTINFGDIGAGISKSVTLHVTVKADAVPGTVIKNTVITEGDNDPTPPPPVVDPDPPIVVDPNARITKVANVSEIQAGQSYFYTITVSNTNGTTAWNNVIATDKLDSKLNYVSYTILEGANITVSQANGEVTINFGDIPIGEFKTVRINVSVKSETATGVIPNTVRATSDNYTPVEASFDVDVVGEVVSSITKEASTSTVIQGQTYTYSITARNNGTTTWTNVVGTDRLDTSLISYVGSSSSQGVTVTNNSGVLTINFGDIAPNASKTVTISVNVNWGAAGGSVIQNTVTATGSNGGDTTGTDPVQPVVQAPKLTAEKTSNRQDSTYEGQTITYEITVQNTGNAPAYDVVVNDNIPYGLEVVANTIKVNGVTSNYTLASSVLKVGVGNLAIGQTATVTFDALVTTDAIGKTIENTGTATGYSNKNHGPSDTPDLSDDFSDNNKAIVNPGLELGDHFAYIIGYKEDGTIRPERNISRAETATIVFRLLTSTTRNLYWSKTNYFTDVDSTDWFNNAISTMTNMGIVNGYPDGSFLPNTSIKRGEFAAIMARFDSSTYTGADKFTDIGDHWAREYINRAAEKGWVQGDGDGKFRPEDYIKRDEAMTFINRVLEREHITAMHSDMTKWSDNLDTTKWWYEAVQEATNSHDYERDANGYETWTAWRQAPDWAALESEWSNVNS